ncbi:MAG: TetR/AcrR family transcriptional regulator [Mycobacteriaceae bacterium]|nr:TetR/AcrR family transcriptional regulator [Mycobacteriaceae bacterium]
MKVNTGDAPARRKQSERTAATRALLMSSARKLFAEKGFGAVSTEAIVAAAGVTRGALYHQFDDKAALFAAVYEQVEQELVADVAERLGAAGDQLQAMRVGARLFLDLVSAAGVQQIVVIDAPTVLGWQGWRAVGIKYGLGIIEAIIAHAIADGVIPDQPPRPTAHVLLAALDEAALYIARAADTGLARDEMEGVCDRVIAGIAGRDVNALPAIGLKPTRRRP